MLHEWIIIFGGSIFIHKGIILLYGVDYSRQLRNLYVKKKKSQSSGSVTDGFSLAEYLWYRTR